MKRDLIPLGIDDPIKAYDAKTGKFFVRNGAWTDCLHKATIITREEYRALWWRNADLNYLEPVRPGGAEWPVCECNKCSKSSN